jgi:predicted transposase YdaD
MKRSLDAAYKLLFSTREIVRDLITGFIADPWLGALDLATLEKVPTNFVDRRLRQRTADVVWRVRTGAHGWTYLYLLIEFQSRSDHWMAVRVMGYVALLWQDLLRRDEVLRRSRKLPPVIPVVVYSGLKPWRAATDVHELLTPVPDGFSVHLPRLKYLLIDQSRFDEAQLRTMRNLLAAVMRLERPSGRAALLEAVADLRRWVTGEPELERVFSEWIRAMFADSPALADNANPDLQETEMGLRETLKIWRQEDRAEAREEGREEGREDGREDGRKEGEALLFQRLLGKRFGPLPSAVVERIASASPAQIEAWSERVFDAASLDEVFSD